jgi:hypothetical protein
MCFTAIIKAVPVTKNHCLGAVFFRKWLASQFDEFCDDNVKKA